MSLSKEELTINIPKPRQEIEELKAYSAPLEGRRGLIRLDFNENTIGPSPMVIDAIKNIPSDQISIYPEYSGLKEKVADSLNKYKRSSPLQHSEVGIFNGVDAAIHAIFHSYGDQNHNLITTSPTFGYYSPCAKMQGMNIIAAPYEGSDFRFPFEKIKDLIVTNSPKIILICNPNNPTGTRLEPHKIIEIAELAKDSLVVIDELYEAFTGDSVIPIADFSTNTNLVVLRSLSKTAGLAGLRIGFAIGNSQVIDRIGRVTGPYDINSFAVTAAFAALEDQKYIDSYVCTVLSAQKWIKEQLINAKVKHHIGGGNYLLIWPATSPQAVEKGLKEDGILIRNMNKKHLLKGAIRVSIGSTEQMKSFWKSYSKIEGLIH